VLRLMVLRLMVVRVLLLLLLQRLVGLVRALHWCHP
jgi:hypothetical protein